MSQGTFRNRFDVPNVWYLCFLILFSFTAMPSVCIGSEKILILPFGVSSGRDEADLNAFSDHLDTKVRSAISLLGENCSILSQKEAEDLLGEKIQLASDEDAQRAGKELGADLVVYGSLSSDDSLYRLRGIMWDRRSNRITVSTDLKVANIHALPGVLQFFINGITKRLQGSPTLPLYKADQTGSNGSAKSGVLRTLASVSRSDGPWRSPEIQGGLNCLDVGDVDGDKKNETVFVGESGITISRFEGDSLRSLTQFSQSPAIYLSAETQDLDQDGIAELVVCYQTPSGVVSDIIRYVNRNLSISDTFPNMILATVEDSSTARGRILVGQRTNVSDMFSGEMVRFEFRDGKAVDVGKILLPPGTFLLSYASGRLGESKEVLRISLNQDQRLMVFDEENRLLHTVNDKLFGLNRRIRVLGDKGFIDVAWPGRVLMADTKGDGRKELLVMKSRGGRSEIEALGWEENRLIKIWNTSPTDGLITDFRIQDFKNNGIQSLILLLVKPDPLPAFSGNRTVVFAYDLIP